VEILVGLGDEKMKLIPTSEFENQPMRKSSTTRSDITILIDDKEVPLKFVETWPKQIGGGNVDIYGSFEVYGDLSEEEKATLEGLRNFKGSARYFWIQIRKGTEITRFEIKCKVTGSSGSDYTFMAACESGNSGKGI